MIDLGREAWLLQRQERAVAMQRMLARVHGGVPGAPLAPAELHRLYCDFDGCHQVADTVMFYAGGAERPSRVQDGDTVKVWLACPEIEHDFHSEFLYWIPLSELADRSEAWDWVRHLQSYEWGPAALDALRDRAEAA